MNEVRPDFECTACGHGVFGKEPTKCPKCHNITSFRPLNEPLHGTMSDQLASGMRRIMRDAAEVRELLRKSGHRKRFKITHLLADADGMTGKALRLLVTTPEPFGHKEKPDD